MALSILCACSDKQQEQSPHSVMLVSPDNVGTEKIRTFSGVVEEAKEINLGFKVAGQVNRLYVKEGDHVRQGQLVATLDDADYRLGAEALQIQYDQLSAEVGRMKQLHAGKGMSDNDYEKAIAGMQQVKVQLQTALNKIQYTRLYAPVDGYIQRVNTEQSEMVNAGTPVITLLNMNGMEVKTDIPADIYARRDSFGEIICKAVAQDGKEYAMKPVNIVPKADGTQLYRMRLTFVGSPDKTLTAGMNVEIGIQLSGSSTSDTFSLPLSCIFQEEEDTFVWTVDKDSVIHKTKVSIQGTSPNGEAVIGDGLAGNDQVVKAGVNSLHDGEKVKIINNGSKTNKGGLL